METNNNKENPQENQDLIDAYLLGNLEAKELAEFNEKMNLSTNFKQKVEEQKTMMESAEEINIKDLLEDFHKEIEDLSYSNWMSRGRLALAASVLILIAVSSWAIFFHENSAERVFAENFKPDPGLPTTMGTTANYNFYFGMVNYKRKNYTDAIASWEPLYAANPTNDTLVYFLGVANLANNNPRQAEKYLLLAQQNSESVFIEEAKHYLALTLLRKNNISEAKAILSKSQSPSNIALLKALEDL
ncbi:hypothetical protein K8089_14685 [Aequorivita sp. F47161]|uniref:Tetratricopeptide repeat protein n=1 Tax=Aequorivita vitellina TaxID=2874475 RepID=A0A9X1U465_9FLAO|nr:hypothetical protein [Aequorivita vitellina]MCG2420273.1 hypothetical protein [Aequorivita vitellina]